MSNIELTVFMIITPPDLPIAEYTLLALKKTITELKRVGVIIYLNGLSECEEIKVAQIIDNSTGRVFVKKNREMLLKMKNSIEIGKSYITDQGAIAFREGYYENGSEVWSRELLLINSPYVGIIDADFEIFNSGFIASDYPQLCKLLIFIDCSKFSV